MSEFYGDTVDSDAKIAQILDLPLTTSSTASGPTANANGVPSASEWATTTDEFIRRVQNLPAHEQLAQSMPYLKRLHQVVHHILPQPNQGLWEPELGLDHFVLSYLCLWDENRQRKSSPGSVGKSPLS